MRRLAISAAASDSDKGATPLHMAIFTGLTEMVVLLIKAGADTLKPMQKQCSRSGFELITPYDMLVKFEDFPVFCSSGAAIDPKVLAAVNEAYKGGADMDTWRGKIGRLMNGDPSLYQGGKISFCCQCGVENVQLKQCNGCQVLRFCSKA